ncbi:MAG: class I SAM-dependent methyltransferase [Defluviitaleaceae bacterium]|nr:class I SAM-dependent methyltransferase [Defluviitaleaceae bacterium]
MLELIKSENKKIGVLADIGCDHAYVPIAAILSGLCDRAVACDVRPGPLMIAKTNIAAHSLSERIVNRLGDGLEPLGQDELECVVIAGIGGINIADMLWRSIEAAESAGRLILQPQRDAPEFRRRLHQMGFSIEDEILSREGGRFYTALRAKRGKTDAAWDEIDYLLGKHIIKRGGQTFRAFVSNEAAKFERIRTQILDGKNALPNESDKTVRDIEAKLCLLRRFTE